MAQPLLKRRLNPLLLISTVAALVLVAGVSVIALDRIDQMQEERKQVAEQLQDKNQTIQELEAEKQNMSTTLEQFRKNYSTMKSEVKKKESIIENRTEKIQNLQQKVEDTQTDVSLGVDMDAVRQLNNSLEAVCKFGAPFSGSSPEMAAGICQRHGHEVGE